MLQTKEVTLDSIHLEPTLMRMQYNEDKYEDLKQSIKQAGILHPLLLMETDKGLLLVSGARRYKAAQEIGLTSAPCYILKIGMDDAEIMRLHENLFREDISPHQEALSFHRLEHTYHFTREKIAKMLGKSKSYVTQRLQILSWQPFLQTALQRGHISYSIARELSVITDETECMRILSICITSGATVRTVLQWIKEWKEQTAERNLISSNTDISTDDQLPDSQPNRCFLCDTTQLNGKRFHILLCSRCYDQLNTDYIKPTDETPLTPPQ